MFASGPGRGSRPGFGAVGGRKCDFPLTCSKMVRRNVIPQPVVALIGTCAVFDILLVRRFLRQFRAEDFINCGSVRPHPVAHVCQLM